MYTNGHLLHGTSGVSKRGRALVLVLVMLALLVVTAAGLAAAPAQAAESVEYDAEETLFVNLLNEYRAANGRGPLRVSDTLSLAAQRHSSDMGTFRFFSHTTVRSSWFPAGYEFNNRIAAVGYGYNTQLGENIGAGQFAAQTLLDCFKASKGHNDTMLNSAYTVVGIGRVYIKGSPYGVYWTLDFGGYVDSSAHWLQGDTPGFHAYDQSDSRISFGWGWTRKWDGRSSAWSFAWTGYPGANVTIKFYGSMFQLLAKKGPCYGMVNVVLRDKNYTIIDSQVIDLYAPADVFRQKIYEHWGLSDGPYTVHMIAVGEKNPNALMALINLDSVVIDGGYMVQAPWTP